MPVLMDKLDQEKLRAAHTGDPHYVVTVLEVAHHRNGICGAPFFVALVKETVEEDPTEVCRKVITMMDSGEADDEDWASNYMITVLDVDLLHANIVTFGQNSWRGDVYRPLMLECIAQYHKAMKDWWVTTVEDDGRDDVL